MDVVTVWEEIPRFTCEHDEAKFWLRHRIDAKLMEESVINADQNESTSITLRIDRGCWRGSNGWRGRGT